ncbi:hypothetical protein VI26_11585 [Chromobacterium sp. LK1]|nr:hypothetical protein VI26_11585 [Chromobacterium sp. LK1]
MMSFEVPGTAHRLLNIRSGFSLKPINPLPQPNIEAARTAALTRRVRAGCYFALPPLKPAGFPAKGDE